LIGRLRRMLSSAFGRHEPSGELATAGGPQARRRREDSEPRIDAARRRLKATIPPPED
jgi:hypothetical protein